MPRVFMIVAAVTLAIFIGLFYQNSVQQKHQAELLEYETVLEEKTESIAQQAQDWSKPIQIEIVLKYGGETQDRTGDTRIFNPLLYLLSYHADVAY